MNWIEMSLDTNLFVQCMIKLAVQKASAADIIASFSYYYPNSNNYLTNNVFELMNGEEW